MANYQQLKQAIANVIKTNGEQAITGQVLQGVLNSMVSVLGANYMFAGVATPATNPGTPDQNVFYFATQLGTYSNFGGIQITERSLFVFLWKGTWTNIDLLKLDDYYQDLDALVTQFEEQLRQMLEDYQPIVIEGDVTNAPDEEDLTSVGNLLRLKNRNTLYGMGYIYLRRELGFAEQLTQENTIYVIRYDYTLTEDVTIPANCVLKFDGGSISGAFTITGQNTGIIAGMVKIFNTDVNYSGNWSNDVLNIKWFGAKGDNTTDDTLAFKNCIESEAVALGGYKILINKGTYIVSDTIFLPNRGISIAGECKEQLHYDETYNTSIRFIGEDKELFRIKEGTTNISFERLSFRSYRQDGIDYKNNIAIKAMPISTNNPQSSKTIIMRECNFLGFGYQFYVSGIPEKPDWQCDGEVIENCKFTYPAKAGIYINSRNAFDYALIQSCGFSPKPLEDNRPAYGIEIDRCGFFKVLETAASALLGSVSPDSEAAIKTAFCNISDLPFVGNIVFEQIQAESINRTINVYNITGGDKRLTFNNSIFDSEIYLAGRGKFVFNNCEWHTTGKVVIDGNDINLFNVPFDHIELKSGGIGSYCKVNDSIELDNKKLHIKDLSKISVGSGLTVEDFVTPYKKRYTIVDTDTRKEWHCINTVSQFINSRAYKFKLYGNYNIGQDGHFIVKLKINSLNIVTLDTLTNSDLINGKFYKEYCFCLRFPDSNILENAVMLDLLNVTGEVSGIVELLDF